MITIHAIYEAMVMPTARDTARILRENAKLTLLSVIDDNLIRYAGRTKKLHDMNREAMKTALMLEVLQ